jgi:hypothetical protein
MKKTIFIIIALIWSAFLQSQNITVSLATVSSADTLVQVTVPFYVSGLSAATGGTPVVALEFYVYYNNTQVDYVNTTNFYSGTPASQWVFGSNGTRFGSNWVHPQLLPISIPDGTKLFDIIFYYKKPVNSILNVSETECVLVNAAFQQIPNSTINFVDGAINYSGFVPPPPGLVEIIPNNYISFPDSVFSVPINVSGFGLGNSSLSSLTLNLNFSSDVINYLSAVNFDNLLPVNEWTISYEAAQNSLICTWNDPLNENVVIPDNSTLFELVFTGADAGLSSLTFDSLSCNFVHRHNGQPKNILSDFGSAEVEIFALPNPPPGTIEFTPDLFVTYNDSVIIVPVFMSGFGSENSSLSDFEISIDFDNQILEYLTVLAFDELLPADEWSINYNPTSSKLTCTWNMPTYQNLVIPENTKLFEIAYKALVVGNTTLNFDAVSAYYHHQFMGYSIPFTANYNSAQVQVYDWTVPLPGFVEINPEYFVINPDTLVYLPIVLSGFGEENSSLSEMQLVINFDDNILNFQSATAFGEILPVGQWNITYDQVLSRLICNWEEPLMENIAIADNTTIFELVFKASDLGMSAVEFDSTTCIFIHQLIGSQQQITANFGGATVEVIEIPLPPPGLVKIVPENFLTNPDSLISVPFVVSGFGQETSSLSDMELVLEFDNSILEYQTTGNFSTLLPAGEWTINYESGQSRMVCSWDETSSQNLSIPDNTTLFELVFKATAIGQSVLHFDSISSGFIHLINGTNQQTTSNFGDALAVVVELPTPPPGLVKIIPENFLTNPDSLISVPFVVSGFGQENSSLSDMELVLEFDNNILDYQTVLNFNNLLPAGEWTINYEAGQSRMVFTWDEPTSQNVSIPDNTTLFELLFKATAVGQSVLHFDSIPSYFIHRINGTNQQITANFGDALAVVEELPTPPPGLVAIVPDYFVSHPGLSFNVPLQISGFSENISSLSKIELALNFQDEIIGFESATAFSPLLPQEEWTITYEPAQSRMLCVWESPSGNNLQIPNNTPLFELVFQGLEVGVSPLDFDSTNCVFTHQQGTGQTQLTANLGNATADITEITIPVNCKVKIIPETISEISGNIINVPVVFFGFNSDTTTITAAEFYFDFDKTVLQYHGVANFNPLMPQAQWIFNVMQPDSNRFACNWVEPTLQNLSIPDSTTIFEVKFLCLANETALAFDSPANVFVHVDQQSNLVELTVDFSDGYVIVLPDNIENPAAEDLNIRVVNRHLFVEHTGGVARIFNLTGQLVAFKDLTSVTNEIELLQQGIYLISVIDENRQIYSAKIFIK